MQIDESLITNQKESYIEEFAMNEDMINKSNSVYSLAVAPLIKNVRRINQNHIDRKVHELFVKLSDSSNFSFSKMKSIDALKIMDEKLKSDERYKLNIHS
ncbi:hypothetical protein PVAND_017739 [Polypedilum vanderplanki]|uniref:Uncharacterized protein n=1 Tax=Polypedilum vanderplanki TaxID=319348 RepID=A0A9J6B8V6_POLVA|nr:hypothetical protein PVAND_017739 [Polypedilum vanderplanki]